MIGGIAQVKIVLRSRGKFPDSSGWKPVLRPMLRMPENLGTPLPVFLMLIVSARGVFPVSSPVR